MTTSFSATLHLHSRFQIGSVDPRIFGGFLEHMGRAVYEGLFDPGSDRADPHGCRTDVLDALRPLGFSLMRYPGGNFVSGYDWNDGVGPVDQRPTRHDDAWNQTEPNTFGTDEFLALAARERWEPMLAVNLGTGSAESAAQLVEYVNGSADTPQGARRAAHGHPEPHATRLWCLGNEMDGPWQIGHCSASEYAQRADEAGTAMRAVDPDIEFVVCGSSNPRMPSFLEWDRTVLLEAAEVADYLSVHTYVGDWRDDLPHYLAIGAQIDRQIEQVDAVCREVQGRLQSPTRPWLAVDEWNVWWKTFGPVDGGGEFAPHLIEEEYDLADALGVAAFLHSFLRHADVVRIANIAQIVNIIAPVLTRGDELLVQSIWHPLAMVRPRAHGASLRVAYEGPSYEAGGSRGDVPMLDASTVLDGADLSVFITNRSLDSGADITVDLADVAIESVVSCDLLAHDDIRATNSWGEPDAVAHTAASDRASVAAGIGHVALPPHSFAATTFRLG